MKECPKCKSTYSDDSLSFCLSDGAALVDYDPAKTDVMNIEEITAEKQARKTDKGPIRIDLPPRSESGSGSASSKPSEPSRKGVSPLLVAFLVGFLLIVIAGLGAVAVYFAFSGSRENAQLPSNTANQSSDPEDVEELKRKLDELANRIGDERSDNGSTDIDVGDGKKDRPEYGDEIIVTVNSPNDGFLALRSLPNHETGTRIAQIPHGSRIAITECQSNPVKIGSRTGRWCRAFYKNLTGWVFDAWLVR